MKLVWIACLVSSVAVTSIARADSPAGGTEDTAMALMAVMMRCPALSGDGKQIALYSYDPGSDKDAKSSIAVLDTTGAVKQRVSVIPPAVDAARANKVVVSLVKLLSDGDFKRMSRMLVVSETAKQTTFTKKLRSEDVEIDIRLANRKLKITPSRGAKQLATITRELGATDGPCKSVDSYALSHGTAGYDPKTGLFAFSINASQGDKACFGHEFVVTLK